MKLRNSVYLVCVLTEAKKPFKHPALIQYIEHKNQHLSTFRESSIIEVSSVSTLREQSFSKNKNK